MSLKIILIIPLLAISLLSCKPKSGVTDEAQLKAITESFLSNNLPREQTAIQFLISNSEGQIIPAFPSQEGRAAGSIEMQQVDLETQFVMLTLSAYKTTRKQKWDKVGIVNISFNDHKEITIPVYKVLNNRIGFEYDEEHYISLSSNTTEEILEYIQAIQTKKMQNKSQ